MEADEVKEKQDRLAELQDKLREYRNLPTAERTPEKRAKKEEWVREATLLDEQLNVTINGNPDDLPSGQRSDQGQGIEQRGGPLGKDRSYRAMFGTALESGDFKNADEFLGVLHSGRFDERLNRRAMTSITGADGGFSVPGEFAAQWLDSSLENEIVRPRATVWPMLSDTRKVPGWDGSDRSGGSTHGGFKMEWLDQEGTGTRQAGKMRRITLNAKKGAIFAQISNELAADGMGFEEQLKTALIGSIGFGLDDVFFFGGGAGLPAGAFSSANPALITVAKESGQLGGTIVYENLAKMYARMAPASLKNAIWHANMTAIPQLLTLSIPTGTAGVFVPALRESNGKFYLLGIEVLFTEQCKTLGTVGDICLVDWSQYCIGLRKEVNIDKSNAPGWLTDHSDYRAIIRVDGMSTWNAPVTPKNGDTVSPFVTLAERS